MLSNINIFGSDADYAVVSRNANRTVLEIDIDGPNPKWSRRLNLEIRIELHPETFRISKYKMTWGFSPRERNSCDIYSVEGRNPTLRR